MIRFTYLFIKILKKTRLLCTNSNSRDASTRMFLSTNYNDSTILHDSTQWLPQVSYVTSVKPHQKKKPCWRRHKSWKSLSPATAWLRGWSCWETPPTCRNPAAWTRGIGTSKENLWKPMKTSLTAETAQVQVQSFWRYKKNYEIHIYMYICVCARAVQGRSALLAAKMLVNMLQRG